MTATNSFLSLEFNSMCPEENLCP